jgi:hypothetical protein
MLQAERKKKERMYLVINAVEERFVVCVLSVEGVDVERYQVNGSPGGC